ncbi:hypothetical protein L0337_26895 [candidate division KSB1 bacterium]|nr:hypothetical protein [candidate division KSB1 bacterium]
MVRVILLQSLLAGILALTTCSSNPPAIPPARESTTKLQAAAVAFSHAQPDSPRVDYFNASVRPLLEKQCQPCHFKGGKVYAQLPFDSPKTIRELGTRLFSRIKDENEQARIRTFLAQAPDSTTSSTGRLDR